jgi:hypothetical protein
MALLDYRIEPFGRERRNRQKVVVGIVTRRDLMAGLKTEGSEDPVRR